MKPFSKREGFFYDLSLANQNKSIRFVRQNRTRVH